MHVTILSFINGESSQPWSVLLNLGVRTLTNSLNPMLAVAFLYGFTAINLRETAIVRLI